MIYCTRDLAFVQSSLEKHALGVHKGTPTSHPGAVRAVDSGEGGSAIWGGQICGC